MEHPIIVFVMFFSHASSPHSTVSIYTCDLLGAAARGDMTHIHVSPTAIILCRD